MYKKFPSLASTLRIEMALKGIRVKSIVPLSAEQALTKGSSILSEGLLFGLAFGITTFEVSRKNRADEVKNREKVAEIEEEARRRELRFRSIESKVDLLHRDISRLSSDNAKLIQLVSTQQPQSVPPRGIAVQ